MPLQRCYTKHGLRAHLYDPRQVHDFGVRLNTLCGHDAYALMERSRLFRRRLAKASMCFECMDPEVKL